MSLNEYNKHATLGRMAGPATTAAAAAGQAQYERQHGDQSAGSDVPMPGLHASLKMLAFFAVVFLIFAAATLLLPDDSLAQVITLVIAGLAAGCFVIFGVIMGWEAVKFGFGAVVGGVLLGLVHVLRLGWGWITGGLKRRRP